MGSTPHGAIGLDDVARIALALPGVEAGTTWGRPAWKVDGQVVTWERPLGKKGRAELAAAGGELPAGQTIGIPCLDMLVRDALVTQGPTGVFTIAHFADHPAVLVDLGRVAMGDLVELVEDAWSELAPPDVVAAWLAARD